MMSKNAPPLIDRAILAPVDQRVESLFDAIAHGDTAHRAWLKEAIDNHFAGLPVPPPRGKGTVLDENKTTAPSSDGTAPDQTFQNPERGAP